MKQDEIWTNHWQQIKNHIETYHRRPSKYRDEEKSMHSWWKQQKKLLNADKLPPERAERFKELMMLGEQYHHLNQYK